MPNAEWKIYRSGESSLEKHAVVSKVADHLRQHGLSERLLSTTDYTVLMPNSSNHWLKAVVLVGHSGVSIRSIQHQDYFEKTILEFTTPEDITPRALILSDKTPLIKGRDLIDYNTYGSINLKVGITNKLPKDIYDGDERRVLSKNLIETEINPKINYIPSATYIHYEKNTFNNFEKYLREQSGGGYFSLESYGRLLAVSLTPIEKPNFLTKIFPRKSVFTPAK